MNEIQRLLKSIRKVSSVEPVTYMQLSEIIRSLWRPRPKVYSVFQEAHGFTIGMPIKPTETGWVKAKADTEANAKATAIVSEIVDGDNFIFLQEGLVPGDYIVGAKYLLSVITAGAVFVQSDPEVWAVGNYRQMIGTGTADGLLVEIDEGSLIVDDLREIEMSVQSGYFAWRYVGDIAWINLLAVPTNGTNGINGINGIDGINGSDGREIEMSIQAGYFVWRYVGDIAWINLLAVPASLTKATGAEVTTGTDDAKYLTSKSVTDSNIVQSAGIKLIVPITQADYDALDPKISTTLYLITD